MSLIISTEDISVSAIKADLEAFIASASDATSWMDFFASSTGTIILELLSGVSVFNAVQFILNRREIFIQHAQNRSSLIAGAENNGYSVNRGTNAHVTLTITPTSTRSVSKWDVVGSVSGRDVVAMESKGITSGVSTTLEVAIGDKTDNDITVVTNGLTRFRFTDSKISEDFRILKNTVEMPLGTQILDLTNDEYVALTNIYGGVDVFYLNDGSYNYSVGDTLTVQYISLEDITFTVGNISFDYGTITSSTTTAYIAREGNESIRVNAPLYNETQWLVRGREDYLKIFKQLDTGINDTNGRDLSVAEIELTYVNTDQSLFSAGEKTAFITSLSSYRPFGVKPPTISDPISVALALTATIKLTDTSITTGNITTDVEAILDDYELLLQNTINLDDVEEAINELTYVKTNRLTVDSTTWAGDGSSVYARGVWVTPVVANTYVYECIRSSTSHTVEPVWPTTAGLTINERIITNEVIAVGDGSSVNFTASTVVGTIDPGTITITADTVSGTDDGFGNIDGTGISGTVNYDTGAIDITYVVAPANATNIEMDYQGGVKWKCYSIADITNITMAWNEYRITSLTVSAS